MNQLYIVRHCQAEGQHPDAPLTAAGRLQAEALKSFFSKVIVDRIISSPFARAQESVRPLAKERGISVQLDERLAERVLSAEPMPDWLEKLRRTFVELDLCFPGGESSRAAIRRAVSAVEDVLRENVATSVIVTHGALLTLLLAQFESRFGFMEWQALTNPDVFLVALSDDGHEVKRVWGEEIM